jgi:hypothetical protein
MAMVSIFAGTFRLAVLMAVVPEFGLVEQKEKHQANQQHQKQVMRLDAALKSFGQQVHKGGGHQRARSHAQHVLGVTRKGAKTQKGRQPDATHTGRQGAYKNG